MTNIAHLLEELDEADFKRVVVLMHKAVEGVMGNHRMSMILSSGTKCSFSYNVINNIVIIDFSNTNYAELLSHIFMRKVYRYTHMYDSPASRVKVYVRINFLYLPRSYCSLDTYIIAWGRACVLNTFIYTSIKNVLILEWQVQTESYQR